MSESTLREKVLAAAFPELVDHDSDDEILLDSRNDTPDIFNLQISGIREGVDSSGVVDVSPNCSFYTIDTELMNNKEFRYVIGQDDPEQPSVPTRHHLSTSSVTHHPNTPATVSTDDPEWPRPTPNTRKNVTVLDLLFLGLLLIGITASPVIVSLVERNRNTNNIAPLVGTTSDGKPLEEINHDRVQAIREWVGVDDSSGDAQKQAVYWLADRDLSYILGEPIPSKQTYNDYQVLADGGWFLNREHELLEKFRVHVMQRYALLVIAFANRAFVPQGGWLSLTGERLHECLWPGVHCTDDDIVTELKIDQTVGLLKDTLPTEIGLLSSLHAVLLSNSGLNATLSSNISKLTKLEFLDLTNGRFKGTIPEELGSLQRLQYLYLATNEFEGTVPSELGALTELKALSVHDNRLQSSLPKSICDLTKYAFLESLTANCMDDLAFSTRTPSVHNEFDNKQSSYKSNYMECECCTFCF